MTASSIVCVDSWGRHICRAVPNNRLFHFLQPKDREKMPYALEKLMQYEDHSDGPAASEGQKQDLDRR